MTTYEKLLNAIGASDTEPLRPMHIPDEPTAAQIDAIISLPDVGFMAWAVGCLYHATNKFDGGGTWWFFGKDQAARVKLLKTVLVEGQIDTRQSNGGQY